MSFLFFFLNNEDDLETDNDNGNCCDKKELMLVDGFQALVRCIKPVLESVVVIFGCILWLNLLFVAIRFSAGILFVV